MVKFGIELVPDKKISKLVEYSKIAEENNFENIWVTDHFINRDVFVTLTSIALNTKKSIIGAGVVNPYTRNIMVIASAVKSLYELAPGRVVLGFGLGDKSTLDILNIKRKEVLKTAREAIEVFREIFSKNKVQKDRDIFNYKGAKLFKQKNLDLPIYMGAQGPKMLALAGKISDGVLVNGSHPADIKYAIDRCGNPKIDFAAYTSFSLAETKDEAIESAKPIVAFIVGGANKMILKRHNIDPKLAQEINRDLALGKFFDAKEKVNKNMVDAFSICGTKDDCIRQIKELIDVGTKQIVIGSPIAPDVKKAINIIGQDIIPIFCK